MEKKRVTIRVAGKDYNMTSSDSEAYVRRVAAYVDRKIGELTLATRLPAADAAVLTAITLADDAFKAQDENTRLRRELDQARLEIDRLMGETGR
ncbi:MAG: cell division protein ZapA [Eubacteriales bacterium]|nr:cell division protein ZapA [Eubacteriales bacterium]